MKRNFGQFLMILLLVGGAFGVFIYYKNQTPEPEINLSQNDTQQISDTSKVVENKDTKTITAPNSKPTPEPPKSNDGKVKIVNQSVPFTSQAPTGQWEDERQQDGCEEASALMAMHWIKGIGITREQALTEILAISDYEQKNHGEYRDISLADVRDWIFKDYYKYDKVAVVMGIQDTDIIKELNAGNVVLLPMNGQKLHNPYFTAPGPERHMILVRGYDSTTDQFITNDPGTKRGEGYRYSSATIMQAILVYPTGYHEPANDNLKGMIVIKK